MWQTSYKTGFKVLLCRSYLALYNCGRVDVITNNLQLSCFKGVFKYWRIWVSRTWVGVGVVGGWLICKMQQICDVVIYVALFEYLFLYYMHINPNSQHWTLVIPVRSCFSCVVSVLSPIAKVGDRMRLQTSSSPSIQSVN